MLTRSVVSDSLQPHGLQPARLLCPWDSPAKNTGVDCHDLLQGIFTTQGLNPGLPLAGRFFTCRATREAPVAFCPKPKSPTGAPTIALHSGIQPTALCQGCRVPCFGVKQRRTQILPLLLLIVPLDKLGNLTKPQVPYLSKRSDRPYLTGLLQR